LSTPWVLFPDARAVITRVGLVLGLSLAYAAGLVGHGGIPFWLATFIYVSLFILLFDWRTRSDRGETRKGIVMALVYGAGTAFLVSYVFQEVFLVRLP
jgi:putative tricarboxylic transport membrane protein